MNQGQFDAIISRLDRLITLLEAGRATAIVRAEMRDAYEKATLMPPPVEPAPAPPTKPTKKGKAP